MSDPSKWPYKSLWSTIDENRVQDTGHTKHHKGDPSFIKTQFFHHALQKRPLYSIVGLAHVKLNGHITLLGGFMVVRTMKGLKGCYDIIKNKMIFCECTLVFNDNVR